MSIYTAVSNKRSGASYPLLVQEIGRNAPSTSHRDGAPGLQPEAYISIVVFIVFDVLFSEECFIIVLLSGRTSIKQQ